MTSQSGAPSHIPAITEYDPEATLVARAYCVPDEAFGPISDRPTVLAKAPAALDFGDVTSPVSTRSPASGPMPAATRMWDDDAPTMVARVTLPPTGAPTLSTASEKPEKVGPPPSTQRVVVGIWTATAVVLSALVYLVH